MSLLSLSAIPVGMLNRISQGDYRLMRRVHQWPAPRWIRLWMLTATRAGGGWLWEGLGFLLLAGGGSSRYAAIVAASSASGVGAIAYLILKRIINRPRPCALGPHCWATLLPPDRYSFPSGHTIIAFAVAIPVGLFYLPLMAMLLFCALSIGASRILLGMHFLSDVVAGALIGTALGYASFLLLQ